MPKASSAGAVLLSLPSRRTAISAIHVSEERRGWNFLWRRLAPLKGLRRELLGSRSSPSLAVDLRIIGCRGLLGFGIFGSLAPQQGVRWLAALIGRLVEPPFRTGSWLRRPRNPGGGSWPYVPEAAGRLVCPRASSYPEMRRSERCSGRCSSRGMDSRRPAAVRRLRRLSGSAGDGRYVMGGGAIPSAAPCRRSSSNTIEGFWR